MMYALAVPILLLASVRTLAFPAPAQAQQLPFPAVAPTSPPEQIAGYNPVHVALGVMSRCPDATLCEAVWDRVLEERLPASPSNGFGGARTTGELVQLELVFLAHENASAPYGATCMHGEPECRGNVQQLCAAHYWGEHESEGDEGLRVSVKGRMAWQDWWNFVQCMNYDDRSRVGSEAAAKRCALIAGREWNDDLKGCVEGRQGRELLRASIRRAKRLGVQKSCTVLIEEEQVCIHDGTWKACPGGHEVRDFAREVREAWLALNPALDGGSRL
ncbi:hypothetical protein JCM3770_004262 [Rhodotorula araucariae]